MNPLAGLLGFTLFAGTIALVISILVFIFNISCMLKIFNKAGENSLKALIPFYNTAILAKISHINPYVAFIITLLYAFKDYISSPIPLAIILWSQLIFSIILTIKLAKIFSFPVSLAVIITAFFDPIIFYAILAFGPFTYMGSKKQTEKMNQAFNLNGANKDYEPQSDFFKD